MSGPNVMAGVLAVGVLVVGGAVAPAHAGTSPAADPDRAQPLTVISLTDDDGSRTGVAVAGLDELADSPEGAVDAARTGRTTALAGAGGAGIGRGAAAVRLAATETAPELENIAVLTPPTATDEFMVAGLTWEAGDTLPAGGRVFLRVLEDGSWTEWLEVEAEDGADEGRGGRAGTDPFVTGGAAAVQIQVTGAAADLPAGLEVSLIPAAPDPAAAETVVTEPTDEPAELPDEEPTASTEPAAFTSLGATRAGVVTAARKTDPTVASDAALAGSSSAAALAGSSSAAVVSPAAATAVAGGTVPLATTAASLGTVAPAAVTTPRPVITSRAGWGADESLMDWRRTYAPLRATVVHHTAGSNTYAWDESASVVRGIYHYHSVTRGWGDIGYNFLVDRWGRVFEGRSGSLAAPEGQMVVGGHAQPFNSGTLGISAMGTFTSSTAPGRTPILDSMADVIAWQFARAGIDMTSPSGLISNGTPTLPAGQNLPRIFGHKDVSNTSCPGLFYGDLGRLSADVEARMPQLFILNNAWDTNGDVQFRYGDKGAEVYVGDWDGDGIDTVATRLGAVFSVRNANAYGEADVTFTYGRPGDVILVGDWDGDGRDTLAVRRGREYHVRNSVTSGPADTIVAYGRPEDQVVVGDWDADGRDTFAVRRGAQYFLKNSMVSGDADQTVVYGREEDTILVGDWNGNGHDTLAVRRGAQYFIKNTIAPGQADITVIYGRPADRILVGDWDRDGLDTLGVRRP